MCRFRGTSLGSSKSNHQAHSCVSCAQLDLLLNTYPDIATSFPPASNQLPQRPAFFVSLRPAPVDRPAVRHLARQLLLCSAAARCATFVKDANDRLSQTVKEHSLGLHILRILANPTVFPNIHIASTYCLVQSLTHSGRLSPSANPVCRHGTPGRAEGPGLLPPMRE